MRLLVVGADSPYAIERHFIRHLKGFEEILFFPAQNQFLSYYTKGIFHKIWFRLGFSSVYKEININLKHNVESFRPNCILIFKGMEIFPETLDFCKSRGILLANYNPDNPFIFSGRGSGNSNITKSIDKYSIHFTYSLEIADQLKIKTNSSVFSLPFGYELDDDIFFEAQQYNEINKICFIGNPDIYRAELINKLANAGITIDVYGNNWKKWIKSKNVTTYESVYNNELWFTLRMYRVQLNIMRPHNLNSHNMRTFEIPAVGGIQLAPRTIEHSNFFEEDREIFLYSDIQECILKCEKLLQFDSNEVDFFRRAARDRCLQSKYSYASRAEYLSSVLINFQT